MTGLYNLTRRNLRLFFKDKGMFFTSLITPLILLVLYVTFLARVFKDSYISAIPEGLLVNLDMIDSLVAGQLTASLLAVSCVTVSFCANLLMIGDKADGTICDLTVAPVKTSVLSLSYFFASAISTLIVSYTALAICLIYIATQGWYISVFDLLLTVSDVFLLTIFGTGLSSCINFFLKTNGQASAVGTIVSAGYGFVCGAYMPMSNFSEGLRIFLGFLPGTYGTSLIKNHMIRGTFDEMINQGYTFEVIREMKEAIDVDLFVFGKNVPYGVMYLIFTASVIAFIGIYVIFNLLSKKKIRK